MVSLGETAVYIRLNDTLGHFSPRWTWLKWFIYALQLSSSLCSNQSTGCSERKFTLQKFIPSYPVYCIVKILVNLLIGYSFFLCSSHSSECHSYVFKCCFARLFVCLWFLLFFTDCCQARDQYLEQFKDTLNTSVAKSIAGFFAEPIQVGILTLDANWA